MWIIGDRDGQRAIGLNVVWEDENNRLFGTCQFKNEGPIGFRAFPQW